MTRGSTLSLFTFQFLGGSGPFNLTGWSAQAQVRVQSGEDVILDLEPEVSDATAGIITTASFSDEETSLYEAGVYQWDLILINVNNEVFGPYLQGQFYIVNKITDS